MIHYLSHRLCNLNIKDEGVITSKWLSKKYTKLNE